ncbi:MAG: SMC family ATPase [Nanoarchaeota archaeon]|nr:SMC family ATPase [Nanoarchaeota archaeon]
MLLKQLTLTNIRSYSQETITFPTGSILLSGDIGAGKSTLLLAIEFALFGSSRPELPAESLLQKGTTKGMVELHCTIDHQEVIIQRNLKKENDAIKQAPGYLIINNVKKELMPVELKAAIIALLGYPEDVAGKNKNYIFRYTVYTPQEGMKLILHEDADVRQDVLRRIFNIDKYKIIRENLQLYLRQMRMTMTVLSSTIEPLEEHTRSLQKLQQEKQHLQQSFESIQQKAAASHLHREQLQKNVETLEQQQQQFQELQQQEEKTLLLLKEKKEQLFHLEQQEELITLTIAYLVIPPGTSLEHVKAEIAVLETERNKTVAQKTALQQRIQLLQRQIQEDGQEISFLEKSIVGIKSKEEEMVIVKRDIEKKHEILEKKRQWELVVEETSKLIAKIKTLSEHAGETQRIINSLENCPTCLQLVPHSHKQKIIAEQQQKITQSTFRLRESEQKNTDAQTQKKMLEKEVENIAVKERKSIILEMELKNLYDHRQKLGQKQEALTIKINENQLSTQELAAVQEKEKNSLDEKRRKELQRLWDAVHQRLFLEKQAQEVLLQTSENKNIVSAWDAKLQQITMQLQDKQDCLEMITITKKNLEQARIQERETAVAAAGIHANVNHLGMKEKELQVIIEDFTTKKNNLIRLQEIYHWLDEFLYPLTNTIEKQIMITIHHQFTHLFKEWFSMIIDDETMTARIDDSFTPVIEQNGYEISFANLSGGEKTAAALAYRLALNRVINDVIHSIKTKELLILDEPTDGFSSEQLDKIRDVLERLQLQQTIIVSHESKIESFVDHVIKIRKEGSRSIVQ